MGIPTIAKFAQQLLATLVRGILPPSRLFDWLDNQSEQDLVAPKDQCKEAATERGLPSLSPSDWLYELRERHTYIWQD